MSEKASGIDTLFRRFPPQDALSSLSAPPGTEMPCGFKSAPNPPQVALQSESKGKENGGFAL